jgi:hypothetical protein
MNLYTKLVDIRKSVEYLQKTERGNQGAMYVDPAVLVQKIRAKMDDAGILLVPSLSDTTVDSMPDPTKANPNATSFLFRSKMLYTFIDAESGEKLDVPWYMTGKHLQDPAMAGGAALTYFERYFLLKFFQIPTSKDDPEHFHAKTATSMTEEQIKELSDLIERTGTDLQAFLKHAKADTLENIQPSKFGVLKAMLLTKEQKVKGAA